MTRPDTTRPDGSGVGRDVAAGLEVVARDWVGRVALFTALLLVVIAGLAPRVDTTLRVAGVALGAVVAAAVVAGWWRKAPARVQWPVAVVGGVVTVGLLVVIGRA